MKFKDIKKVANIEEFINGLDFDKLEFNWDAIPLYHYTSSFALKNIIEYSELWLSQVDFLNDRNEIKYTLNLADKIINEMLSENPTTEELVFQESFKQYFNRNFYIFDVYVLSLSKNQDSNLLWANYSDNDGYNIEFEYPYLANNMQKRCNSIYGEGIGGIQSYYVVYDADKQKELLQKEICDLYVIFNHCFPNNESLFKKLMAKPMANILMYSIFFKDACFAQEEEFRIALIVRKDKLTKPIYNCRISEGVFIPYLTIPFNDIVGNGPIRSITIGPKNNLDIAEEGLKKLLQLNNLSECKIYKSKIPYRY